jgi:hypothetical protein
VKWGRNLGHQPGVMGACLKRIDELRARHGRKVSLVGWSLGGLFAPCREHLETLSLRRSIFSQPLSSDEAKQ